MTIDLPILENEPIFFSQKEIDGLKGTMPWIEQYISQTEDRFTIDLSRILGDVNAGRRKRKHLMMFMVRVAYLKPELQEVLLQELELTKK